MFIDLERVEVYDEAGVNCIAVRRKMDMATRARVMDAVAAAGPSASIGTYQLALLRHNILAWSGPDFCAPDGRPVPCTPEHVDRLDPDAPLVARALNRIGELNPVKRSPDPKSRTASGSRAAGGPSSRDDTADESASMTET